MGRAELAPVGAHGVERTESPLRVDHDDPLMTAGEVALLLRVTTAWVYTQTRAGHIPHVQLGRYVRYRRSAVVGWIEGLEQGIVGDTFGRTQRRAAS
jgi:excisionase family DNA binding protein